MPIIEFIRCNRTANEDRFVIWKTEARKQGNLNFEYCRIPRRELGSGNGGAADDIEFLCAKDFFQRVRERVRSGVLEKRHLAHALSYHVVWDFALAETGELEVLSHIAQHVGFFCGNKSCVELQRELEL